MVERVVVAVQVGTPATKARTWPLVPAEVVERFPVPFPRRTEFAWKAFQPVPPTATERVEEAPIELVPVQTVGCPATPEPERSEVLQEAQETWPWEYERGAAKVVVAVHEGTPPTRAKTWPFTPAEVVAIAPEPFPRRMELAWMLFQPVPP
jgi:hypothetical protein